MFARHIHRDRMIIIGGGTVSQYGKVSGTEPNDWSIETGM